MVSICEGKDWVTYDPLGIGGLLCNAFEVAQLVLNGYWNRTTLIMDLLRSSQTGLEAYLNTKPMQLPADHRLAFRELGLSLGLHAIEKLRKLTFEKPDLFHEGNGLFSLIETLHQYVPLIQIIEGFWLEHKNRQTNSWKENLDINMVMLATSLAPTGYLGC
jgi:hypothetical protein